MTSEAYKIMKEHDRTIPWISLLIFFFGILDEAEVNVRTVASYTRMNNVNTSKDKSRLIYYI